MPVSDLTAVPCSKPPFTSIYLCLWVLCGYNVGTERSDAWDPHLGEINYGSREDNPERQNRGNTQTSAPALANAIYTISAGITYLTTGRDIAPIIDAMATSSPVESPGLRRPPRSIFIPHDDLWPELVELRHESAVLRIRIPVFFQSPPD